jgi:hypothetical protein
MNTYIAQRYGSMKSSGSQAGTRIGQSIRFEAANNQTAPTVAEQEFATKDLNVGIKLAR